MRSAFPAPVRRRQRHPAIDRLPGSCHAAIARLERTTGLWPGAVFEAFHRWKAFAHGPLRDLTRATGSCGIRGCCPTPDEDRDLLEAALHRLPGKSARELRLLVRELDETVLARAVVIPHRPADPHWWRHW